MRCNLPFRQDHDKFDEDGVVSANTVVLASHAECQIVSDISFSLGVITGVAYGFSIHINTTDPTNTAYLSAVANPSAFGIALVGGNDTVGSVSPVVFWDVYSNGAENVVLATSCKPEVTAYRGDVLLNATNNMMIGVENLGPLRQTDLVALNLSGIINNGQVTDWNPLNNTALNA
jgi:hypothetical protein